MLTPEILSSKPSGCDYVTPAYNWDDQSSGITKMTGGDHTFNSIQTFDNNGQPSDSQNDNND